MTTDNWDTWLWRRTGESKNLIHDDDDDDEGDYNYNVIINKSTLLLKCVT
jgi:hypothetical protein